MQIGEAIDRFAAGQQIDQGRARVGGLQQRPGGRAARDACQQQIGISHQPAGNASPLDEVAGLLRQDSAASKRKHARPFAKQAGDDATLARPEIFFAEALEDFGDRQTGGGDDFLV